MRRPRLRTLLLLINVVILVLPLAGIWFLRLYESALIRQTESELVAQGAVLGGAVAVERRRLEAGQGSEGSAGTATIAAAPGDDNPRSAGLDLAEDPVLPPPPDPLPTIHPPAPLAAASGNLVAPILRAAQRVTLAAIRITDPSGVIVATTGEDLGLSLAGLPEIGRALIGKSVSVMRRREQPARASAFDGISRGAGIRVFVAMPVVDDGKVVGAILLSRTPRDLRQAIYGKRFQLLALAGLLLGAGILLAVMASWLITRPLDAVIGQAKRVAAGKPGGFTPLAGPGTREAAELSEAVARMAATLERRAEDMRNFAAHVSHEFKTPLAGAKGALELLGDHFVTMSAEERGHFLGVANASVDRLEQLVRRLVDFARADMVTPGTAHPAALAPILERVAARYRERGLDVDLRPCDARLAVPDDAVEIMLGSLLENALDHAPKRTRVGIAALREGGSVAITVADDGPGIAPGDAARIFEPFFTTARASGGTGLGLPIARAIATGAGGTIELVASADGGAAFRLVLPCVASG